MSIALSEFWSRLVRSRLADAQQCRRYAADFASDHAGTPPSASVELARYLVASGDLTEYQAKALLSVSPPRLRFGGLDRIADESPRPFSRCVPVIRAADVAASADGGAARSGVLLTLSEQGDSAADCDHLQRQLERRHRSLMAAELIETKGQGESPPERFLFAPVPPGKLLLDAVPAGATLKPAKVVEIGSRLAAGLQAMHDASLTHGAVRLDRVWISSKMVQLLRDPLQRAERPDQRPSAQMLDQLDSPWAYAAPELGTATKCYDAATDIYGLGCLLFRLLTGRMPFSGSEPAEWIRAHATQAPEELAQAVSQGPQGDPLLRVIAFAMAKDPAVRFSSAQQLAETLRATLPLLNSTAAQVAEPRPEADRLSQTDKFPEADKPLDAGRPAVGARKTAAEKRPAVEQTPAAEKAGPAEEIAAESSSPRLPPVQEEPTKPRPTSPESVEDPRASQASKAAAAASAEPLAVSAEPKTAPAADMPAEAIQPPSTAPVRSRRKQRKRKNHAPLVLGALTVPVLVLVIMLIVRDPSPTRTSPARSVPRRPPAELPSVVGRSDDTGGTIDRSPGRVGDSTQRPGAESAYALVDDEQLLWAPPYPPAAPPPLSLLPPGPAVIVTTRLADITTSSADQSLVEAFSPELTALIDAATTRTQVTAEQIQRLSVALHPGQSGRPEVSLAVNLAKPLPMDDLLTRWDVVESRTPEGSVIYAGDEIGSDAFFLAMAEDADDLVRGFAVGSVDRIREVAEVNGGPIPLPTSLKRLWSGANEKADLVILATPNFLFADGRHLLAASIPEAVDSLKPFLIPDVSAALLVGSVADQKTYLELRLSPSGGVTEAQLLRRLHAAIGRWPSWAEAFILQNVPDPSWRLLATRLPFMMSFLADHTRYGLVDRTAVANLYLPAEASAQVGLATLLALNTKPSAGSIDKTAPAKSLTIEQMLDRSMSVSFGQESLEFAVDAVVDEFEHSLPQGNQLPPVRIVGGDLEKMGITQNQQIRDFAKSDVPLRQVLTDLVVAANPDKTASGPADPKQSLIWVVAQDPSAPDDSPTPDKQAIVITTRHAAAQKGYDLPAEFESE